MQSAAEDDVASHRCPWLLPLRCRAVEAAAVCGASRLRMDAAGIATIAEITNLSPDKVRSVVRQYNNDQSEVERAVSQYLEGGGGPFKT